MVGRDIKCVQKTAKDDQSATNDNRKSCSINRDRTDNITFLAKGFLLDGSYENFIRKHRNAAQ